MESASSAQPGPGPRAALLLLLAAIAVVALGYLREPSLFSGVDFVRVHELYKPYLTEAIRSGRIPLWNPHAGLGRPFLADIDAAAFYPPHVLYLLLDVRTAWAVLATLHLWLAMVGLVLWLGRLGIPARLAAGLALFVPLAAPLAEVLQGGLIHYAIGLCYLPWVLYLATRMQDQPSLGRAAGLAVAVGLQSLGGHAQASWISSVGVLLFLVVRRLSSPFRPALRAVVIDVARTLACLAWGFGLAAVQGLPTLELAGQGNRHASQAFSAGYALPWHGLLSLLVPAGPSLPLIGSSNLFGGTVLLVAGMAGVSRLRDRNARALFVLACFSVLLALGDRTPLFRVCYWLLPGCSLFREHARMGVWVLLVLVAGAGLQLSRPRPGRAVGVVAAMVLAAMLLVAVWGLPSSTGQRAHPWERLALVAVAVVLLWLWWRAPRWADRRFRVGCGALLALVSVAELGLCLGGIKQLRAERAPERSEQQLGDLLVQRRLVGPVEPPPRVAFPMPYVRENAGMRLGFSTFSGYATILVDRVFGFMYGMRGLREPLANNFPAENVYGGGPFPFATMNLQIGFDPERKQVFANPSPDPRVYLTGRHLVVRDWRHALVLMQGGHDPHATVLLEQEHALAASEVPGPLGSARIASFAPERIVIETESPTPAWLVVGETWYPGWSATVDGTPTPCLPGNVWMRVVPLAAGAHRVVLDYRSTYLRWGMALSLLCWLGVAAAGLRGRATRRSP